MNYIKVLKYPFFLFVIAYFFFLVLSNAPAAWAAWGLHKAVPSLWLSSVDGSLWSGRARSAQVDIGPTEIALGELTWKLKALSLLTLSPCIQFETSLPQQTISGQVCQGITGTKSVKNLVVDAPVTVLAELIPIKVNGAAFLQVKSAKFNGKLEVKKLDAQLSMQGTRAYVVDTWLDFGNLAVTAAENGSGGLSGKLSDIDGPYKLDMNLEWMRASGFKVAGNVTPGASVPGSVLQGLQVMGEEVSTGTYKVQWPL